jgi:uncharacterized protein YndB with AHSA1/START domain
MTKYEFETKWRVHAPVEQVWQVILDSETWPDWWKGVLAVEVLERGDEQGQGGRARYVWKGALPYKLAFASVQTVFEPPYRLGIEAAGELQGQGLWHLTAESPTVTHVRYDWHVETTKAWMNLMAPLARPLFDWNHDVIMRWGAEGLARRLGVKVEELS